MRHPPAINRLSQLSNQDSKYQRLGCCDIVVFFYFFMSLAIVYLMVHVIFVLGSINIFSASAVLTKASEKRRVSKKRVLINDH